MRPVAPDGLIHSHLAGKTIVAARKDGHQLIIETACGHSVCIGWRSDDGQIMNGEPVFLSQGVQVVMPRLNALGVPGGF